MNITKPILDKIYNIYSNILKIKNGIIYNKDNKDNDDNEVEIEYTNKSGILCKIVINIIIFTNYYYFDALYYVGDIIESYFNNKIKIYYYYNKMNNDLLFIKYKINEINGINEINEINEIRVSYNTNKFIDYKNIYDHDIEYIDKNTKTICKPNIINWNVKSPMFKYKKYINNIWYLLKLYFDDNIIFKYYLFNNYYIYCLKYSGEFYSYYNTNMYKTYYYNTNLINYLISTP